MPVNYYNAEEKPLYVLHFPGTGFAGHQKMIQAGMDRKFKISDQLSLISVMNRSCYENSILAKQCARNQLPLYNTALEETRWDNTVKIRHILQCLNQIETEYALILDGRDTLIVNDLTDAFMEQYLSFEAPIIYNATPAPYPDTVIESLRELLSIRGRHKYLNAGVCIGDKESLISFYTKAETIRQTRSDNHSEQLIIRLARKQNPNLAGIDSENRLFRIIHQYDTTFKEQNGKKLVL